MPAKGTTRFKITPEVLEKVESASARGLNHDEIALALGISRQTLYVNKKINSDFADAVERGKAKGHMVLSDTMFNLATGRKDQRTGRQIEKPDREAAKFVLARRYGWKEHVQVSGASVNSNLNINATPGDLVGLPDSALENILNGVGVDDGKEASIQDNPTGSRKGAAAPKKGA